MIARNLSDETVKKKTGKTSEQWYKILEDYEIVGKNHTLMAKYLREKHKVSAWWAQIITNRYEWKNGLRNQ